MFCIILVIELAGIIVFKELGVFFDGNVQGYSFGSPGKYKPTKQAVWCTKNLHGTVWNSGSLNYNELPNILPSDVKGEYFVERLEKKKTLGSLTGKELENLEDHGCPKVQDLVYEET